MIPRFPAAARQLPPGRVPTAVRPERVPPVLVPEPFGLPLFLLYGAWIMQTFDVHWLLAAHGPDAVVKIAVLLLGGLLLTLALGVPGKVQWSRRWQWSAPFLLYILAGAATLPFVANKLDARITLQVLLFWWTLIVGTVTLIGTARRAELLVLLYGLQFLWFALWGASTGLVPWHPTLSNHDGFGAVAVGGIGFCYYLAMATPKKRTRWTMYVAAALCAFGVISSFARGAFLAAVLVFGVVWLRSPHKGRTLVFAVLGCLVMMGAATLLFGDGVFIAEIRSIFEEGTTEGTGEDRWILWGAAWQVFLDRPVFGAGVRNWGAVAAGLFQQGELGGMYANPGALYNMALHNLYMTTLSELGLVGTFALVWLIVDYFRRNAALRTPEAQRAWAENGGTVNLRAVSLGLEAAMIGFLLNAGLYSMMVIHWFYTMIALNLVLHSVAVRLVPAAHRTLERRGMLRDPRIPAPLPQQYLSNQRARRSRA
jgi:O-antigen ligase